MSPSGPLQNHSHTILDVLEKAVGILSGIQSSQDIRQQDDKLQDERLVRLNKGMGLTYKMVEEIGRQIAELRTEVKTQGETVYVTRQRVDEFLASMNKTTKQADEDHVKSVSPRCQPSCVLTCSRHLIQDSISQALPQVVHQAIIRVNHQRS
jgi:hypothetical protein